MKQPTDAQLIQRARKLYAKGKHPDVLIFEDELTTVDKTDDGTGVWVSAAVWVSLEEPPRKRNGRRYK